MTADAVARIAPRPAPASTLSYLPVGLFGSVMGLAGLSLAWRQAAGLFGVPAWPAQALAAAALLAFCVLAGAYATKAVASSSAVRAEFASPVAGPLFGTPIVSLLLLPLFLAGYSLPLARAVWCLGAVSMTVLAGLMVDRWIGQRQQTAHAVPSWIVPVVGMIDIPLAVPALEWPQLQPVMMFALAVGLFFALPLFTIILSRLMFEAPIAPSVQPSLLILVAPFAVGFSAYATTAGSIDRFAQSLYMVMLFLLAVMLRRLRHLPKCCPFRVAWWSASFPLAASAAAALRYAAYWRDGWSGAVAAALLAIATGVVLAMLVRTIKGVFSGELQHLSEP